jgi:hypothetical protein
MKLPGLLTKMGIALSTAGAYLFFARMFKKKKPKKPTVKNPKTSQIKTTTAKPRKKKAPAIG